MKREIYNKLVKWKNNPERKPLILDGARQVGKTWILKEFGKNEYKNVVYINCDKETIMKTIFSDFDTGRLIRAFSAITNQKIEPENTLIILDEIQTVELGLTSLKYFYEDSNEYHIIAAGSLLGIQLHQGTGYPVGCVDEMKMYPMSFSEFLLAMDNDILLTQIKEHRWSELTIYSDRLKELLRQYYYVGGMPEVVASYILQKDLQSVRKIQKRILNDYEKDFSRHISNDMLPKVQMVWNSIPSQLAKENKKFIYGSIKKGARAKDFENAIQWLINAGLVYKVNRVSKVARPLKFYEDFSAFKLFISDLGLLGAMTGVTAREVLVDANYFVEYKGAFTEQYVAQEINSLDYDIYYYSKVNSPLEIDFIVQKENIYPIEVKSEENLKSKSLRSLYDSDNSLKPCRFSMAGYVDQEWMQNVPLYFAREWICNQK